MLKFILTLSIALLVTACGSDSSDKKSNELDNKTNSFSANNYNFSLSLYPRQDNFTLPSFFEFNTETPSHKCSSADLVYLDGSIVNLDISFGNWFSATEKNICLLENLPDDITEASSIIIRLEPFSEDGIHIDVNFTEIVDKNLLEISSNTQAQKISADSGFVTTTNFLSDHSIDFAWPDFDHSGATTALQFILSAKFSLSFSEYEIAQQLLKYGEAERIEERRGFSLLDIKQTAAVHEVVASGFSLPLSQLTNSDDLENLDAITPFLAPFKLWGSPAFTVIEAVSSDYFSIRHPGLGYIQIPTSKLIAGHFKAFSSDDFIFMRFEAAP